MYDPHALYAFDRAASKRRVDLSSGHLHVADCRLSKAEVSSYLGSEVPGAAGLGMDARKLYPLLRSPAELAKAAKSFEGKPLMLEHRPQSAADHDHGLTVGSVHNVRWQAPYLVGDLSIWDGEAIRLVQSGRQKNLSCGYFYDVERRPGAFDGTPFVARMVNLRGNHIALVTEGRVADAMVGDAAPVLRAMDALMAKGTNKMDDDVKEVLSRLIQFMQGQMSSPSPELDDLAIMVDGPTDASGNPSAALDRRARRNARQHRAALDAKAAAGYAERFPNGNRLLRGY